ncbi:MAG: 2,3,4,5-tetrahydropyridine-2,6-dicarboxylate N-succinyltransferase (EC [uncultured Campylobacterales bacterium]|uniref:2,3,4,5-tetrahydropyridine-2,6-dicarboxylate N-succinyltransferase (EC) n=1 Tax=uncultured Campylobacterales bacterium TaxID=352960 RepID=A0A6S6S7P0_9BACT|nr:MAG: 2,3,4,5-tetrahydropyridine-2,6-dicarboxylate N-succinyltransferase (EC [uncultured Campylobacterales bacterium]
MKSKEEFKKTIQTIQSSNNYKKPLGFGVCRVDRSQIDENKTLQATFPLVNWDENFGSAAVIIDAFAKLGTKIDFNASEVVLALNFKIVNKVLEYFEPFEGEEGHSNIDLFKILQGLYKEKYELCDDYKIVFIFENEKPKSVESVYLKLYALSQNKAELRSLNLDGAFGLLQNVAWSGNYPIDLEWLRVEEIELKLRGEYPSIDFVDKFPRFLQHIIPADNTRVLDTSRVRFGAALAAGTTVMPGASYINFNAGTTGAVMVEGRISSSAVVKAGADVGGGASILGVLSGTNGNPITIGENTLLGANSVTGIPLGSGCIIDAGLSLLEGTKIYLSQDEYNKIKEVNKDINEYKEIVKGLDISGLNGIHFRQNSQTGQIIARRSTKEVKLNSELH